MKIPSSTDFSYKHTVNKIMHPEQDVFEFYNSNNKEKIGTLVCHKSEFSLRPNHENPVLAIDFIEVSKKDEGVGTKILKFSEKYSEFKGCQGYLTLKADSSITPERVLHIFYRKFGFSTLDKKTDKKMDKFIKSGTNATVKDFPCMLMHYPPQPKRLTFIQKFAKFARKLFK